MFVMLISFLIPDLPNLLSISFFGDRASYGSTLSGDNRDDRKEIINGYSSYDNTLIMRSKLKGYENYVMIIV